MQEPLAVAEMRGVRKSYQGRTVLNGVDLTLRAGTTNFLVGPNGCGKTTTVETLVGLRKLAEGRATLLGTVPGDDALRPRLRVCLQGASLHPQVTVREHFQFLAALYGQRGADVASIAERFGLQEALGRRFGRLSGGQQKRVLVAGCLFGEAELIVLDEPTSGVDLESRLSLWESLRVAMEDRPTTLLATTHDLTEAEDYADNVAIMRDGTVVAEGRVNELIRASGLVGVVSMPTAAVSMLAGSCSSARTILSKDRGTTLVGYTDSNVQRGDLEAMEPSHAAEARERSPRLSDVYLNTSRGGDR